MLYPQDSPNEEVFSLGTIKVEVTPEGEAVEESADDALKEYCREFNLNYDEVKKADEENRLFEYLVGKVEEASQAVAAQGLSNVEPFDSK